ncbi:cyclic lactone autoinducer peptide [Enterocloster bolteae]
MLQTAALSVLAMAAAVSPCLTRLYEPELPEQLKD